MPKDKKYFSEADNGSSDVSNVLRDPTDIFREEINRVTKSAPAETTQAEDAPVEIDVEAGAPFTDGIDPEATVGEYSALVAEEEPEEEVKQRPSLEDMLSNYAANHQEETIEAEADEADAVEEAVDAEVADTEEEAIDPLDELDPIDEIDADAIINEAKGTRASHPIAEPVRQTFVDDMERVVEESTLRIDAEPEVAEEEEAPKARPGFIPVSKRIKKPRFSRRDKAAEKEEYDPILDAEIVEEPAVAAEESKVLQPAAQEEEAPQQETTDAEDAAVDAPQPAPKKQNSICEDLHRLQKILEEGKSPVFHKDEVLVPREETLDLIRSLTAICDVDASYIDYAAEDALIDHLVEEEGTAESYRPMKRARERSRSIINQATRQADTIIHDAKTLSRQILAEADAVIKEKYDTAEKDIRVLSDISKEESVKKLNEARSELTYSRQRSVEILSKYMEKAEDDYQGYWERAEQTLMASMKKSESILGKAADIYKKELDAIRQDKAEIDDILERLRIMENFNNSMKNR